jgi:hypothetical protein
MKHKKYFFFHYMFYRFAKLFKQNDPEGFAAALILTFLQCFVIAAIVVQAFKTLGVEVHIAANKDLLKVIIGAMAVGIYVLNVRLHRNRLDEYSTHWADESKMSSVWGGVAVWLCFFGAFLFFMFSVQKH